MNWLCCWSAYQGTLVHNKQFCAHQPARVVKRIAVAHMIALTCGKNQPFSIPQFYIERAIQTQNYVTLPTPVIGNIAWRVFNHADSDVTELFGSPLSRTPLAGMYGGSPVAPINDRYWDRCHLHAARIPLCGRRTSAAGELACSRLFGNFGELGSLSLQAF